MVHKIIIITVLEGRERKEFINIKQAILVKNVNKLKRN